VPAESAVTASAIPASVASFLKIASAVGERQMFPVHTNKTPNLSPDIGLPNIESARETYFGTPRRRAACASTGARPRAGLAQQAHSRGHPFCRGKRFGGHFSDDLPAVETNLGQRFVVESKPGADGAIGTGEVVRAAPDGYTLLLGPTAVYAVTPHMFRNLGFDPLTALDPISLLADAPLSRWSGRPCPRNRSRSWLNM